MAAQNWAYRKSDGQFIVGGFYDVQLPLLAPDINGNQVSDYVTYGVLSLSDAVRVDLRLHRWDGASGLRDATTHEIVAYDLAQPKLLNTRELIRRLTGAESRFLLQAALSNDDAAKFVLKLITDASVDVHSPEWQQGVAFFVPAGITAGVWIDETTANQRIQEITL